MNCRESYKPVYTSLTALNLHFASKITAILVKEYQNKGVKMRSGTENLLCKMPVLVREELSQVTSHKQRNKPGLSVYNTKATAIMRLYSNDPFFVSRKYHFTYNAESSK
jgi:hypothetical protein